MWPFFKLAPPNTKESEEVVQMIVQLEIENKGKQRHKFKSEDRYLIGIIAQAFAATIERINTLKQANDGLQRSYGILNHCKKLYSNVV